MSAGHVLFFSSTKSNLAVFRQDKFQFSRTKQDKNFFAAFGKKTSQFSSFLQYRGHFYIVGHDRGQFAISNPGFFRKKIKFYGMWQLCIGVHLPAAHFKLVLETKVWDKLGGLTPYSKSKGRGEKDLKNRIRGHIFQN